MRLRHLLAPVCGALALAAALTSPAYAATGDFHYQYVGLDGHPATGTLHDPPSDECVTLPEVADPNSSEPAFAPHNDTDAYARLFTNPDCTGDSWTLRPHGNPASDRLKLRSVVFLRP
ncbi:hypothetical protein ACIPX0_27750 [Streptomyces sp. NPDC090075]|uniref:hypothetical protein n=1 Tax=unclassified Streptomyces TaxID=2593676 RepID=UPI0033E8790D